MKTNADTNFYAINTKIVKLQLLIPAYQEFIEMRGEAYFQERLKTLSELFSFKYPMVPIK